MAALGLVAGTSAADALKFSGDGSKIEFVGTKKGGKHDGGFKQFTGMDSAPYLNAIKDWAEKGEKSEYAMSEDKLREKMAVNDPNILMASAEFGLGEYLYKSGHATEAIPHFKEAQKLNPKSWNYKRQAYALGDAKRDYGTTFIEEVNKAGGSKVYYPPPDLPGESAKKDKKPE